MALQLRTAARRRRAIVLVSGKSRANKMDAVRANSHSFFSATRNSLFSYGKRYDHVLKSCCVHNFYFLVLVLLLFLNIFTLHHFSLAELSFSFLAPTPRKNMPKNILESPPLLCTPTKGIQPDQCKTRAPICPLITPSMVPSDLNKISYN